MKNLHFVLWVMDQNHVCDLSIWVSPSSLMALFAGLCISLAWRLAPFASWFLLFPLGVWAFLTVGLLPRLGRPCRGYCVPHMRDASGLGTLSTAGRFGVLTCRGIACMPSWKGCGPFTFLPTSSSLLSTFRWPFLTQPHQGFTRVHPSALHL